MKSILLPYYWYSRWNNPSWYSIWNNPMWLTHPLFYCTLLLCVQGPVYVRQALCHWAMSSAFEVFTLVQTLAQLPRLDLNLWPSWYSSPWDHRHVLSTSFLQWYLWNLLSVILKHDIIVDCNYLLCNKLPDLFLLSTWNFLLCDQQLPMSLHRPVPGFWWPSYYSQLLWVQLLKKSHMQVRYLLFCAK